MVTFSLTVGDNLGRTTGVLHDPPPEAVGQESFRFSFDKELGSGAITGATVASAAKRTAVSTPINGVPESFSPKANNIEISRAPFSIDVLRSANDRDRAGVGHQVNSKNGDGLQNVVRKSPKMDDSETLDQLPESKKEPHLAVDATPKQTTISEPEKKDSTSANWAASSSGIKRTSTRDHVRLLKVDGSSRKISSSSTVPSRSSGIRSQVGQSKKKLALPGTTSKAAIMTAPFSHAPERASQSFTLSTTEQTSFTTRSGKTSVESEVEIPKISSTAKQEPTSIRSDTAFYQKPHIPEQATAKSNEFSSVKKSAEGPLQHIENVRSQKAAARSSVVSELDMATTMADQTVKRFVPIQQLELSKDAAMKIPQEPSSGSDGSTPRSVRANQEGTSESISKSESHDVNATGLAVFKVSEGEGVSTEDCSSPTVRDGVAGAVEDNSFTTATPDFRVPSLASKGGSENHAAKIDSTIGEKTESVISARDPGNMFKSTNADQDTSIPIEKAAQPPEIVRLIDQPATSSGKSNSIASDGPAQREPARKTESHLQVSAVQNGSERLVTSAIQENSSLGKSNTETQAPPYISKNNDGPDKLSDSQKSEFISNESGRSLEMSISGGTQGWLKVRAEIAGGSIHASITSNSESDIAILHRQVDALNSYLQREHVLATVKIPDHGLSGSLASGSPSQLNSNNSSQQEARQHNFASPSMLINELSKSEEDSNIPTKLSDVSLLHYQSGNGHSFSVLA